MLIHKDLPGAEIPEIGPVKNDVTAQYVCALFDEPWPLIMNDGNFVAFYEYEDKNDLLRTIKNVGEGEYQFYCINGTWYGAVKIRIDYSLKITKKELFSGIFRGTNRVLNKLEQKTDEVLQKFSCVCGKAQKYRDTPIFSFIEMNCDDEIPKPSGNLKSNISIMQTGENMFAQVMNITNLDMIPNKLSIIDKDIIKYIGVIVPNKSDEKKIKDSALDRMSIMKMLAPKETTVIHVHTICSDDEPLKLIKSRIAYIDFNLIIQTEDSLKELDAREKTIRERLIEEELSAYTPTNGQRQQFLTMLPGLAVYSETMQLVSESFIDKVMPRILGL